MASSVAFPDFKAYSLLWTDESAALVTNKPDTYLLNDNIFPRIRSKQFSAWLCRVKFFDFSIFEGQKSKCVDFFRDEKEAAN